MRDWIICRLERCGETIALAGLGQGCLIRFLQAETEVERCCRGYRDRVPPLLNVLVFIRPPNFDGFRAFGMENLKLETVFNGTRP